MLNRIADNNILNDILVLLNKEKIKESFENIIGNKAGMEKYKDKLIELYISIPGSFENKISFLDELLKNRELEKQKRNTVMSFFDLFEKNNFGKEFIKQLYLFDDKGVGKGELLLLTVFRDTKTIGKGDISTNSHLYEVKARASKTGGRLANNNYPEVLGVNQVKRIIMQILQENQKEYGINLDNIKLPSGKNDYNLKTGADNWLKIMKQLNISENKRKDFMVKVLKEIIKEQWSVSDNDVKWVEKDIKNDGTWDKKFLQDIFLAESATQKEVVDSIVSTYTDHSYVIDPHTANAFVVYKKVNTSEIPTIIYSTAEWTKFSSVLAEAFSIKSDESEKDLLNKIASYLQIDISPQILKLFEKEELHKKVVDIYGIDYQLLEFAGIT